MKYVKLAFAELIGMFVDDGALALAAFALILALTAAVKFGALASLVAAALLLIGCVAIITESLVRSAKKRFHTKR